MECQNICRIKGQNRCQKEEKGSTSEACHSKEIDSMLRFFSSGAQQAIRIYLPSCLYAYCWRMYWILGGCCSSFYTDQDFPPQELKVTMACALHDHECLRPMQAVQRVAGWSYMTQCFAQTLSQNSSFVFHGVSWVCAVPPRPEGLIPWESGW